MNFKNGTIVISCSKYCANYIQTILTFRDIGKGLNDADLKLLTHQNAVFEHGFCMCF